MAQRHGTRDLLVGPQFKRRTRDTVDFTAISATGSTVAVIAKQKFWIFNAREISLACSGVFEKKKIFKYARGEKEVANQHPTPDKFSVSLFSCVALSDDYLAIGTTEKVMVFAVNGEYAGRWVMCDDIPKAGIMKLAFSPDGKQLVALMVVDVKESCDAARIYSTDNFAPEHEHVTILRTADLEKSEVTWQRDYVHSPSGIAFSRNGNMVAICTTHSKAKAEIRILKKEIATWRVWGKREVSVHLPDHREWHNLGLTGISLYIILHSMLI